MRRTRNRKHRGGMWPFSNASANASAAPANAPAAPAEEKPGFFSSLFGKKNAAPAQNVAAPAVPNLQPPTGGKRKNRCGMWGGSHLMGAPVGYNQVQAMGGQPSERIMQYATTAGGRHKNRSHRKHRSHRNKSRKNKSRKNKSRRNRKN